MVLSKRMKVKDLLRWGYSSFKEIKIGDLSLTDYFRKVYEESVSAGNDFATTMKILWAEAQKYEKEISRF